MSVTKNPFAILLVAFVLTGPTAGAGKKGDKAAEKSAASSVASSVATGPAVLWRDPADISSRDLFYGPGGERHAPLGPFTFVKEDMDGTNPKFVVIDKDGVKWKVKMGLEARPETVASRIAWAAGYYANEDFFVKDLDVHEMPVRLQRGQKMLAPDGSVHNVRLKREDKDEKKIGNWQWRHDAFTGTRELNGLKVVMALVNNWDLKDENNAIYQHGSERIYMISDLGASFGSAGRTWPREKAKDNLDSYSHSKFIRNLTPDSVDFQVPARPRWVYLVNPKEYLSRVHLEWIGTRVPRGDVRWMGQLLARLSGRQIRDAFRAAGYTPQEVEGFARILEQRITVLTDL
jgi:hypothetical protein